MNDEPNFEQTYDIVAVPLITEEKWVSFPAKYKTSKYEVSNWGQVRSSKQKRILKCPNARIGFYTDKGPQDSKQVSFLVAESFLPNPQNFEHLRYLNGNCLDAKVTNLQWTKSIHLIPEEDYKFISKEQKKLKEGLGLPRGVSWHNASQTFIGGVTIKGKRTTRKFSLTNFESKEAAKDAAIAYRHELEERYDFKPKPYRAKFKKKKKMRFDPYGCALPLHLYYRKKNKYFDERYFTRMHYLESATYFDFSLHSRQKAAYETALAQKQRQAEFKYDNRNRFDLTNEQTVNPKYLDLNRAWKEFVKYTNAHDMKMTLTKEQWLKFVLLTPSDYCGSMPTKAKLHTLDRVNSEIREYSLALCVSACFFCNIAKNAKSVASFFGHLRLILLNSGFACVLPPPITSETMLNEIMNPIFPWKKRKSPESSSFERYKSFVAHALYAVEIDSKTYNEIINERCFYCGCSPTKVRINIDRFDSRLNYTPSNSVPCCRSCNALKNGFAYQEVLYAAEKILNHHHFRLEKKNRFWLKAS